MMDMYGRNEPSPSYTWYSFPMRPPEASKNRMVTIREIVVRAQGEGTIQVIVYDQDNNSVGPESPIEFMFSVGTDAYKDTMQRSVGGQPCQSFTVSLTSASLDEISPAPTIWSIAIGYEEMAAMVSHT